MLPPSVKSFVDARTPSSLSSASELADLCFEITQSGNNSKFGASRNNLNYTAKSDVNSEAAAAEVHKGANAKGEQVGVKKVRCFLCNGWLNHKQKDCKNSNKSVNFRVTTCFICSGRHRTDQCYKN